MLELIVTDDETPGGDAERVSLQSVTAWVGSEARHWPDETGPRPGPGCPVWVEMRLDVDPTKWIDPWDAPDAVATDWSAVAGAAASLGFTLPHDTRDDPAAAVLRRLPHLNELGGLRWVASDPTAFILPLAGFIPTCTLEGAEPTTQATLEFVLVRVSLAVVGDRLFTLRLPDRLCTGARRDGDRRIDAREHIEPARLPNLDVFPHFLPAGRVTASDLGDALGTYLSATCACVSEYARRRLHAIEREVVELESAPTRDAEVDLLCSRLEALQEVRGALQMVEEELLRLLQRLDDVELAKRDPRVTIRRRYQLGLDELRAVERDCRRVGDALAGRLSAGHLKLAEQQAEETEKRDQTFHALVAILGAVLVIAAAVPSNFSDDAKLPAKQGAAFVGMLLIMLGAAGAFWIGLSALRRDVERQVWRRARERYYVGAGALSAFIAGVLVLSLS